MVTTLTTRSWRVLATAAAAAVTMLVAPGMPVAEAEAAVTVNPRPGEPITWGSGRQTEIKTYQTGNGSACSLIASPNSVGGICLSANGMDGPTIKEVLDGDPLPECWHEKLTREELDDLSIEHGDGEGWYWRRCLVGVDPKTFDIEPGGIYFAVGIWYYSDDDPQLVELTPNQVEFIARFVRRGNVPQPMMLTSPSPVPWVNDPVSFYNATEDELHVDLAIPGVAMRGRITEMIVYPEGQPGKAKRCDGSGIQVEEGDTPETVAGACWYTYEQSSQTAKDDTFRGEIHVRWQIDARIDGEWQPFHTFVKSTEGLIQVNEVQALVRP